MFQVRNLTDFPADIALLSNEAGIDAVYPVLKATLEVGAQGAIADHQLPLNKSDQYRNDPALSGIAKLGDYQLSKSGTDIIVTGDCLISDSPPQGACDVKVQVGNLEKHIRVFGDRVWDGGQISSPEPFERIPVIYERAFGGSDGSTVFDANPIGVGFYGESAESDGRLGPLPNIENPNQLIHSQECQPIPIGIEAVPPHWPRRRALAGTYDDEWKSTRAPYLPRDFQRQFLHSASDGLYTSERFVGGEPIIIENMSETGYWSSFLPELLVRCRIKWKGQLYDIALELETIHLMPNQEQISLIFRGEFLVNQWATKVDYVEFSTKSLRIGQRSS